MAIEKLKKDLVRLIDETDDENLLSMVKEDIAFYQTAKNTDVTDSLSAEQLKNWNNSPLNPTKKIP